jgi:hypothetical protein
LWQSLGRPSCTAIYPNILPTSAHFILVRKLVPSQSSAVHPVQHLSCISVGGFNQSEHCIMKILKLLILLTFFLFCFVQQRSFRLMLTTPDQAVQNPKGYLGTTCLGASIPIVLIARNNPSLLKPLVEQLRSCFNATIIVFDNGSNFKPMIRYLLSLEHDKMITVVRARKNVGSRGSFTELKFKLPRFFALSDSDLRLNDNLPSCRI